MTDLISGSPLVGRGLQIELGIIGAHKLGHSFVYLINAVTERTFKEVAVIILVDVALCFLNVFADGKCQRGSFGGGDLFALVGVKEEII